MGIDTERFSGDIDGDLLCPICSLVLEEPVQAPMCEHAFCNTCITEWLTSNQTCPIDRTNLTIDALKPAPRILRNFLSRLTLSCSNQTHGCPASLTLERLETHILECNFKPKRQVTCQSGCGASILFEELQKHNCFQSLKIEMESKICQIKLVIKKENEGKEEKISKMQLELDLLKAEIAALKKGNPEKQSLSPDSQLLPTAGQSQAVNQGDVFKCGICQKAFGRMGNLKRHQILHTGENKPFKCDSCHKTFSQTVHLRIHQRMHTGEKPFKCDVCEKLFGIKANLKRHQRIHLGEKRFECANCGKTFSQQAHLNKHLRTHTGEKPFKCEVCDNTFSRASSLKRHQSVHTV